MTSQTARVFWHEGSQVVELPEVFRFRGSLVRVTEVGERLILEPLAVDQPMPWEAIDRLGDMPFMPEGREQPDRPMDQREE